MPGSPSRSARTDCSRRLTRWSGRRWAAPSSPNAPERRLFQNPLRPWACSCGRMWRRGHAIVAFVLNGCIIGAMVKLARLKLVRERKALTQQQLAEKAGVNRVTITRLEQGSDQPFPTTVRKLADALGVEPEDLMEPLS